MRSIRGFLTELPVLVVIAFVLALLLKTFLVQAFFIPSSSMVPTLSVGDRVLVNKLVYELRDPRRGEVVVFTRGEPPPSVANDGPVEQLWRSLGSGLGLSPPAQKDFVKRIVGLPGETVAIENGQVMINGEPLPERTTSEGGYLSSNKLKDFEPVTVPEGEYFMLGDNRANSSDSRFGLGTIPREALIGRAFVVIWPPLNLGGLPIADYERGQEAAGLPQPTPSAPPLALGGRAA